MQFNKLSPEFLLFKKLLYYHSRESPKIMTTNEKRRKHLTSIKKNKFRTDSMNKLTPLKFFYKRILINVTNNYNILNICLLLKLVALSMAIKMFFLSFVDLILKVNNRQIKIKTRIGEKKSITHPIIII